MASYQVAHIDDIEPVDPNPYIEGAWRRIRHHFGIEAFGTNAYTANEAGQIVIEDHDEKTATGGHQELYFVHSGRARFELDGETFEAPAGTLVFIGDPAVRRVARAEEPGTTVLAFGAEPGVPFQVSEWELQTRDEEPG